MRDTAAAIAALELGRTDATLPDVGFATGPNARRLRIGFFVNGPYGWSVDPEVVEATKKVAALCEGLGHQVDEIALPFGGGLDDAFILYWAKYAAIAVGKWEEATGLKRNPLAFEKFTLGLIDHYEAHTDQFDAAVARLLKAPDEFNRMFDAADVILSPVTAAPPVRLGYLDSGLSYEEHLERVSTYAQFTGLYNMVGAPAISLPLSMSSSGLPIGAMFGAALGDERTLLELAYELEEAAPWGGRRPAVFG